MYCVYLSVCLFVTLSKCIAFCVACVGVNVYTFYLEYSMPMCVCMCQVIIQHFIDILPPTGENHEATKIFNFLSALPHDSGCHEI